MSFFSKFSDFIDSPVGNALTNLPEDVRKVKRNLSQIGIFDEDTENGYITRKLDDAIKTFQRDNDLKVDGLINPRGETESRIWDVLSGGLEKIGNAGRTRTIEEAPRRGISIGFGTGITDLKIDRDIPDTGTFVPKQPKQKPRNQYVFSLNDQKPQTDATGRMIREKTPPVPERKPVVPETAKMLFNVKNAPVFNNGKIREEILLNNTPAKFEIKENPALTKQSLEERFKKTFFRNEGFGNKVVKQHEKTIEKLSEKHGVDPDLVKAVMWAENARGHGYGTNESFDKLGKSKTQTPMNINGKLWGELIGKPKKPLDDSHENIEAGVVLLKRIGDRVENPTPEKIGSIWNFAGRENVNEIGVEIGKAYKNKPWQKKKN